jgi:predicted nucleotide-binding protein
LAQRDELVISLMKIVVESASAIVSTAVVELEALSDELTQIVQKARAGDRDTTLTRLQHAAEKVGHAWSGSWIGYHANVYYHEFQSPQPGDHFSAEWGLMNVGHSDAATGWDEYRPDDVRSVIFKLAGNPDITSHDDLVREAKRIFEEKREELLSVLQAASAKDEDAFVARLLDETKGMKVFSASDFIAQESPSGLWSRDSTAMSQGVWIPPHITVLAEVFAVRQPFAAIEKLAQVAKRASSHFRRVERQRSREERTGTNVFIGHGRSSAWRQLKDFVQDRLRLPWDEFNRVPVAGITNISRLAEMLDAAAIAFVVMTAEDEQTDGTLRARENVVHEAGLFQGRLGFTRAIILVEEGCQEFSNIHGLGQIRFPKGRIAAAFEEVRKVVEREGLIEH